MTYIGCRSRVAASLLCYCRTYNLRISCEVLCALLENKLSKHNCIHRLETKPGDSSPGTVSCNPASVLYLMWISGFIPRREATGEGAKADLKKQMLFLKKLWKYLTPEGTSVEAQEPLYLLSGEAGDYTVPIKPHLLRLLGCSIVCHSRKPGTKPCLISELMFTSDVMSLYLITSMVANTVKSSSSTKVASPEQERVLWLMSELAKRDPKGPWAEADAMCKDSDMMGGFSACISHLQVFIPNELLLSHPLQVIRPLGATRAHTPCTSLFSPRVQGFKLFIVWVPTGFTRDCRRMILQKKENVCFPHVFMIVLLLWVLFCGLT